MVEKLGYVQMWKASVPVTGKTLRLALDVRDTALTYLYRKYFSLTATTIIADVDIRVKEKGRKRKYRVGLAKQGHFFPTRLRFSLSNTSYYMEKSALPC